MDTVVGPTVVLDDATDMLSAMAGTPGSIGRAGRGPGTLESLVVVIASDDDWSDDPGGVNPV